MTLRTLLFLVPLCALLDASIARAGLEEKRLIERAKTEHIPNYEKKIADSCGFAVKIAIEWSTFEHDKKALEGLSSGLHTGWVALKEVCKDQLGKDAAKAKIKTLRIASVKSKAETKASFDDGVVTAILPEGGAASVSFSAQLARTISAGL